MFSFISGTDQHTLEGTTENGEIYDTDQHSMDTFSAADFRNVEDSNSLNKTKPKAEGLVNIRTTTEIPYQVLNTESTPASKTETTSSRNFKTMRTFTR